MKKIKTSTFAKRLAQALEIRGINQTELSKRTNINKSSISTYLKGEYKAKQDKVDLLANALNVSPVWLMGYDIPMQRDSSFDLSTLTNYVPIAKKKIPLLGEIAAGQPIYADDHIEEFLPADDELHADFALKIKGDSMINAQINDGDIVFIRQQSDVDNGQIAAVLIDDSATLKRVYHMNGGLQLQAENPKYPPMIYGKNNCDECRILGLAVAVLGKIK